MSALAAIGGRAGEFAFTADDFAVIARLAHAHAGIQLEGKSQLVYSRLAKLVRQRGLASFADYVALLQQDADARRQAIYALTTNHTRFFREDHHFAHFTAAVRPDLLARAERGRPVRLWSAACSSGEEPYTLAMHLLGEDKASAARVQAADIAILATDLAPHVLAQGRAARYPAEAAAAIPDRFRRAWTSRDGAEIVMAPDLVRLVAFRQLNLLLDWPLRAAFDVIFCRNVMIYFDEPTKARLLERFAAQIAPGGHLYIGHSERIAGPAAGCFDAVGQTIYRRRG